jgi:hypothetical protein
MAKKSLSRELKQTEVPEDANETLPDAQAVHRRSPNSKRVAGGAEHRAGAEEIEEEVTPRRGAVRKLGAPPEREDPPRGHKPSGAH